MARSPWAPRRCGLSTGCRPTAPPERIWRKFTIENTWRDDDDEIETSSGSPSTSVLNFADPKLAPAVWHAHPSLPATIHTAGTTRSSRLISSSEFSTSAANPNAFMTAANDEHMRLHDTRLPLPFLRPEEYGARSLISRLPAVFAGSTNDEVVRLWDIRARKMVYELPTGNNAVNGMVWDAAHRALFMDRNGYTSDYRRARLPSIMLPEPEPRGRMPNYDDEGSFDKCWPKHAIHSEDYGDAVFDAGNHLILRYAFRDDADPTVSPPYGTATLSEPPKDRRRHS
ncbi:hypothetical protein FB451DRAFT_1372109 [Mycena latifolia]|nr:hypothetical protein FB451DRAFT_1372109 [Mycena latifolia]